MQVIVTGANGFIGGAVAAALMAAGHKRAPGGSKGRGCGFLPLIRDRECRQPFRLLLPAVPLLADVVEHRSEIG
jgi:NAD(P)-dependent dehydrogenase (short-subunit alcohol dehydrogenase family)